MTREEMAVIVERFTCDANSMAIAAELRKTCGSCSWWASWGGGIIKDCGHEHGPERMPADGSGFCHRYESQPAGKAQP